MNTIEKFTKLLKKNGYRNSWDAQLRYDDEEVSYSDQGGYFVVTDLGNDKVHFYGKSSDEEGEVVDETLNGYEELVKFFKGNYCPDLEE